MTVVWCPSPPGLGGGGASLGDSPPPGWTGGGGGEGCIRYAHKVAGWMVGGGSWACGGVRKAMPDLTQCKNTPSPSGPYCQPSGPMPNGCHIQTPAVEGGWTDPPPTI